MNDEEKLKMADNIIPDPGCKEATRLYDKISTDTSGNPRTISRLMLTAHEVDTKSHSPDCYMNRPVH